MVGKELDERLRAIAESTGNAHSAARDKKNENCDDSSFFAPHLRLLSSSLCQIVLASWTQPIPVLEFAPAIQLALRMSSVSILKQAFIAWDVR